MMRKKTGLFMCAAATIALGALGVTAFGPAAMGQSAAGPFTAAQVNDAAKPMPRLAPIATCPILPAPMTRRRWAAPPSSAPGASAPPRNSSARSTPPCRWARVAA